ncbi:hypothetical protein ACFLX2_00415 [Candidatus Dependentiae bacterium]
MKNSIIFLALLTALTINTSEEQEEYNLEKIEAFLRGPKESSYEAKDFYSTMDELVDKSQESLKKVIAEFEQEETQQ